VRYLRAPALALFAAVAMFSTPSASATERRAWARSLLGIGPVGFHPGSFAGDGGPAALALADSPTTVAVGPRGGIYFTDSFNHRIRRIDRGGVISTVAGTGKSRWCGPRPPLSLCLSLPHGIAVDTDGSLLIADTFNHRVLRIRDGRATVLLGPRGLDWPVIARPTHRGMAVVDAGRHRVLLVRHGRARTLAGTGDRGSSGDGGLARNARLNAPADALPYKDGWLISDGGNCRLRWIDPAGRIHLFAGGGLPLRRCHAAYNDQGRWQKWGAPLTNVGDSGLARRARIQVTGFLATDGNDVWVTDFLNHRVRDIDGRTGRIRTILGTGRPALAPTTEGPAAEFALYWPSGIALAGPGVLLVTDSGAHRVIRLELGRR
jgi:hypothetical protein